MRLSFLSFLLVLTHMSYAQTTMIEIKDVLKKNLKKPSSSILVEDQENHLLTAFIVDDATINGYMYRISGNTNQLIGKIQSKKLPKWYGNFVGYTYQGRQIRLIFKHDNETKFGSILYDFDSKRSLISEYNFKVKIKNQLYIQSYSRENQFYTFYASKNDNSLYVHNFSHGGGTSTQKHNLNYEFIDPNNSPKSFYEILISERSTNKIKSTKFAKNSIQTFEKASKKNKMYTSDKGVIFSIDNNKKTTYLVNLNFPDFKPSVETYEKPILPEYKNKYVGNSFLLKDHLYQIKSNPEYLKCVITDIKSNEKLKEFVIEKEKPILFKNSPLIQTGGTIEKYSELSNTKQFLKKISGSNSVFAIASDYGVELTLGSSYDLIYSSPVNTGGFGFGISTTSTKTKSIFIKCKIDENFNPIAGELEPTLFDKINLLKKRNKLAAPKLGTFNSQYIYGGYNKSKKTYTVYAFE